MNEEEAFLREELRRFRSIATSIECWLPGREAIFRQWPVTQAEAIIEGSDYKLPSQLLIYMLLAMGELQLKDEVCPDCGRIVTKEEQRKQKREKAERFLKERYDPLDITREVTMPLVKEWLERLESYIVGQGYRLPRWERPKWLKGERWTTTT